MKTKLLLFSLIVVMSAMMVGFSAQAQDEEFPPAGIDIVDHTLQIQVDVGDDGEIDETLELHGRMQVQRGEPFVNEEGLRQIDFTVMSWVASGWSEILQQNITYVLSEDVEQPPSTIIAEQAETDFPATFAFNVVFDVRANNRVVFRRHEGRPEGHGFLVVPPDGNRENSPTITQFEDAQIVVEHPEIGVIRFMPLDCNDQNSQTIKSF